MWISTDEQLPPDRTKVLGYTDDKTYKIVTCYKGRFDTYMKILFWTNLPSPPTINSLELCEKKKRGRPKKV